MCTCVCTRVYMMWVGYVWCMYMRARVCMCVYMCVLCAMCVVCALCVVLGGVDGEQGQETGDHAKGRSAWGSGGPGLLRTLVGGWWAVGGGYGPLPGGSLPAPSL